jgi:hypothetical protein
MAIDLSGAASGASAGSAFGPWGTVIGGLAGALFGGKKATQKAPKAAQFKPVDAQAEQDRAIAGDLSASDDIESLISRANNFTQDQANGLMEKAVPGFGQLSGRFTAQANSLLDNPYALPDDVSTNLTRLAAERGISTGVRGQANDYSLLRDFGINSLNYGNQRISQAQSILQTIAGLAPKVNPMSPISFYVTPQQQIGVTGANNQGQFSTEQAQNNANAAADNTNNSMWGSLITAAGPLVGGAAGDLISKIGSKAKPSAGDPLED